MGHHDTVNSCAVQLFLPCDRALGTTMTVTRFHHSCTGFSIACRAKTSCAMRHPVGFQVRRGASRPPGDTAPARCIPTPSGYCSGEVHPDPHRDTEKLKEVSFPTPSGYCSGEVYPEGVGLWFRRGVSRGGRVVVPARCIPRGSGYGSGCIPRRSVADPSDVWEHIFASCECVCLRPSQGHPAW